jgi:GNAT superfamily N-acetyltransferase
VDLSRPGVLARRDDGLEISLDHARLDVDRVFDWLSVESYWATGRPRDVVEHSLAGSLCAGVYDSAVPGSPQVALARVVTDDATFAWLCDVYVDEGSRGRGLGTWLMRELVAELVDRRGIQRLLLATRDAHEVYARVGFTALDRPGIWMEIDRRPTRLPPAP